MEKSTILPILSGEAIIKLSSECIDHVVHSPNEFLSEIKNSIANTNFENNYLNYIYDWISLQLKNINETFFFDKYNEICDLSCQEIINQFNQVASNSVNNSPFFSLTTISKNLTNLLIKLVDLQKNSTFLDPSSGFAGPWLQILKKNPNRSITLQDSNNLVSSFAYLNSIVFNGKNTQIFTGDVLSEPKYVTPNNKLELFDSIITIPPTSHHTSSMTLENSYNRFRFGKINSSNRSWGFVSNTISSLNNKGKAAIILPDGDLMRIGNSKTVRKNIVMSDLLETVISLPKNFSNNLTVPCSILVFNIQKEILKNKILFIDANQQDWIDLNSNNKTNDLNSKGIESISNIIRNPKTITNISAIKNINECSENLLVNNYVFKDTFTINNQEYKINKNELDTACSNIVPLEEIAQILPGYNFRSKSGIKNNNARIIKVSNIKDNYIDYTNLTQTDYSEALSKYQIKKNDIILSVKGTIGKTVFISEPHSDHPYLISSNLAIIRPDLHKTNPEWLSLYLQTILSKYFMSQITTGNLIPTISLKNLKKLSILNVSPEIKEKITSKYKNNENEIIRLQNKIAELQKEQTHFVNDEMNINKIFTK